MSGMLPVFADVRKNVLSWALAWTGSVLFIRQVAMSPPSSCLLCMHTSFFFFAQGGLNAWKFYRFVYGFFISKHKMLQRKTSILQNNICRNTFCLLARIADRVGILQ